MVRRRLTKADTATLDRQIIEVLALDNPQSIRHVFYRMTDPRLAVPVAKTEKGYRQIRHRCGVLRRSGALPYGWISDSTRRAYHVAQFHDGADFVERMAGHYRGTLWTDDLPHVEVWCESRSLAGVLQSECRRLAVSLYPAGGFTSLTFAYEAATDIDDHGRDRAVVLYLGDYDPAGVLIDRRIESELRGHLATPLDFRRLAINPDQIERYDLPTKPRKRGERRAAEIELTVEAEAMPAGILRSILAEAIEGFLPAGALDNITVAEESEREGLRAIAEAYRRRN